MSRAGNRTPPQANRLWVAVASMVLLNVMPTTVWAGITSCINAAQPELALCQSSASPSTPCLVQATKTIEPGAFIDCSGIDVHVTGSGVIVGSIGVFALAADDLTIDLGRRIETTPDPELETGFELAISGNLNIAGKLVAVNAGGDSFVAATVLGSISLTGSHPAISTEGTNNSVDGGDVYLFADGNVNVGKGIFLSGTDGGDDTNINYGGELYIDAGLDVLINEELRTTGRWFGGGDITVMAGDDIVVAHDNLTGGPRGQLVGEGKAPTGYGGRVYLAAADSILLSGPVLLGGGMNNGGGESAGGVVALASGCGGIRIEDPVDITGGLAGGGVFIAESDGPITVASLVDGRARNLGGSGGSILISSGGLVRLTEYAALNVDGHNTSSRDEDGNGGLVLVAGCQVELADTAEQGATISARGYQGGAVSIEGAKATLGSQEHSLRVGDKALVDTTAAPPTFGEVYLEVAQRRFGTCSNNLNVACTLSSECVFGCNAGTCDFANPETAGVFTQFKPSPAIATNSQLNPCSSICQ